jgi:hypothetical protein
MSVFSWVSSAQYSTPRDGVCARNGRIEEIESAAGARTSAAAPTYGKRQPKGPVN